VAWATLRLHADGEVHGHWNLPEGDPHAEADSTDPFDDHATNTTTTTTTLTNALTTTVTNANSTTTTLITTGVFDLGDARTALSTPLRCTCPALPVYSP
jgi:hypothetical protein